VNEHRQLHTVGRAPGPNRTKGTKAVDRVRAGRGQVQRGDVSALDSMPGGRNITWVRTAAGERGSMLGGAIASTEAPRLGDRLIESAPAAQEPWSWGGRQPPNPSPSWSPALPLGSTISPQRVSYTSPKARRGRHAPVVVDARVGEERDVQSVIGVVVQDDVGNVIRLYPSDTSGSMISARDVTRPGRSRVGHWT
jgi:hypothetical protein